MISITGTQQEVFTRLLSATRLVGEETPLTIVAGGAGHGKSFVLRMFSRVLAARFLNESGRSGRLPVYMPLQQFPLPAGTPDIWPALCAAWVKWSNSLHASNDFTQEWLSRRLIDESSVLILDSVDEFFMINQWLDPGEFRSMITRLRTDHRGSPRLSIVLGLRSSEPILDAFKDDADYLLLVRELAEREAARYFPAAKDLISRVTARSPAANDPDLHEVLLTPLILAQLDGLEKEELNACTPETRTDLIELGVRASIKKAKLHERYFDNGQQTSVEDWMDALTIIAWLFGSGGESVAGDLSDAEIQSGAQRARATLRNTAADGQMDGGLRILEGPKTRRAALRRTLFFPTGKDRYRFSHREWLDYLYGRYFANCIRGSNFEDLAHAAFTQKAYQTANELLRKRGGVMITESLVDAFLKRAAGEHGGFVVANLGGLIGNSILPVDDAALRRISQSAQGLPKAGAVTLLAGLGYRVCRAHPADTARDKIRAHVEPVFRGCVDRWRNRGTRPEGLTGHDAVLASLSWCYLAEWEPSYAGKVDWPGLDLSEEQERQVVDGAMAQRDGGGFSTLPPYPSAQLAYLRIQNVVINNVARPISVVHYLYELTLAAKHGAALTFVKEQLPAVFRPDSRIASTHREYQRVPGSVVPRIFELCRGNFSVLGSSTSGARAAEMPLEPPANRWHASAEVLLAKMRAFLGDLRREIEISPREEGARLAREMAKNWNEEITRLVTQTTLGSAEATRNGAPNSEDPVVLK